MSTAFGSLTKPPPDLPPVPGTPSLRTSNDMTWMMGYWTAALNGESSSLRSRRASKVDRQEVWHTSYVVRNCPRRLFSLTGQPIHVLEAATEEVMTQATLVVSFLRTVELRWRLFGETCKPICHEGAQEEPIDPVRKLLGIPLLG
ncbi:hypothetical protein E4U28_006168 [Claviceps purpurea]|nr:hypothetical protein E4U28_006168 [Claviceps purpurea]